MKVEIEQRPGSGESSAHTDARAADEVPSARFRRSLAVVIGIDTYGEGIPPLRSAVADAEVIAYELERDHGFEVWRYFDDSARLPRLLTLLREELPAALGPDDRLLFYFAGHGIARDGEAGRVGYLVPACARISDESSFLPMQVLHQALARLQVRHALIVLDCCFAGSFPCSSRRDADLQASRVYREHYDRFVENVAWQVLTSTTAHQRALDTSDGEGSHSPFALALLEGLAGAADYTQDHLITADELAIFVRERLAPSVEWPWHPSVDSDRDVESSHAPEDLEHRQDPQLLPLEKHGGGQFLFQAPDRTLALEPTPPLDEDMDPHNGLQRTGPRPQPPR